MVGVKVKQLMKSGSPRLQSIAATMAEKRKMLQMAKGGMVDGNASVEYGGMEDMPKEEMGPGGMDESMSAMKDDDRDEYFRATSDMMQQAQPQEISNPAEMDEDRMFAMAVKRKAMMAGKEGYGDQNGYAMGGLVQGSHGEKLGTKPSMDMNDGDEDQRRMPHMGGKKVEDPSAFNAMPSGMGLSDDAKMAIMMKKKKRMYSQE